MPSVIKPGLIILHSNQLEQLSAAVFEWIRRNPLSPLEKDIFLVQSNGVAEWLKISLAENFDISAANRIELPGRFLWAIYRSMLGKAEIPSTSSIDKMPLTWRLMRLIPALLQDNDFSPLKHFLADGDAERRYQLVSRLADLIDLYQVYRTDWLQDWSLGLDQLRRANGEIVPLPADQRWQAKLWRAILADLPEAERLLGRVNVHRRFVDAASGGFVPATPLPRRVVLFGVSALPRQTLEALSALAHHTQVILAVPNPCQYFWGDIIEGRELFKAQFKRQQLRNQTDLSLIPIEELHAHAHPLLAGWGRLGRDFVRMLDEFDQAELARTGFAGLKIDLFSEDAGHSLLTQVQAAIRDLLPLAEHPRSPVAATDTSIEFHLAHSVQREVEILHDRLLGIFAEADNTIRPRDVVVMVPDIAQFTPSIRAVFGQYKRTDRRYIPYEIGDVSDRKTNPVMVALDWLLRLPQQRCQQNEVVDLLEVPAIAARFGLDEEDLPVLKTWINGAGIRWGLNQQHRDGLGLGATGEQNSWIFGIRRMLLGYANGAQQHYQGIEPYAEVGGLSSALAGCLAEFVEALIAWKNRLALPQTPLVWAEQARQLLSDFFAVSGENDRVLLARLHESLDKYLNACEQAHFDEAIPLAVFREPWLTSIDEATLNHRFISGGVTFCTFMPMRSMPFQLVCLLGMNEGDFPRRTSQVDFDLLALQGMARPGDRSRRDDDRYLMLEAILAARSRLYISWVGKNIRDNSEQPPSVLVSQLRDYLNAGWDIDLQEHTHEYPMQAFSRAYFFAGPDRPLTYAREWGAAYLQTQLQTQQQAQQFAADHRVPVMGDDADLSLKLRELSRFVRQPVAHFFQQRLGVQFADEEQMTGTEEPFNLDALQEYFLNDRLINSGDVPGNIAELETKLTEKTAQLSREGLLPVGFMGQKWQRLLVAEMMPVQTAWLTLCELFPDPAAKLPVQFRYQNISISDWLENLRTDGQQTVSIMQIASKVCNAKGELRADKVIDIWIRQLVAASLNYPVTFYLVARDASLCMPPLEQAAATATLETLIALWRAGLDGILPVACKTALALIAGDNPQQTYDGGYNMSGEVESPYLARMWPDFSALSAEPDWENVARTLYEPLFQWAREIQVTPLSATTETGESE